MLVCFQVQVKMHFFKGKHNCLYPLNLRDTWKKCLTDETISFPIFEFTVYTIQSRKLFRRVPVHCMTYRFWLLWTNPFELDFLYLALYLHCHIFQFRFFLVASRLCDRISYDYSTRPIDSCTGIRFFAILF